ncbi:hypothetical protein [Terrimonas pollutisoli]|uniref:hypothetical protein n=1 Tax=Terrimonas pollutisoli TaxID=3034147 RepID=UPI0023ED5138|nr:hypothetical protein [Terrimonas sp. H1YJ31]
MRNILFVVLCLQTILPHSLLQDIVRLPVLVTHYFHHNHSGRHFHFTDFIAQHYFNKGYHDKHPDEHDNLPFRHHDYDVQQIIIVLASHDYSCALPPVYNVNRKNKIVFNQHFCSSSASSSVWKPPKFA